MNRALRASLIAITVTGGTIAGATGVASASEPTVQACVGTTFSDTATSSAPGTVGDTVTAVLQNTTGIQPAPGLGDGIQLLQEGQVPDSAVPNACN